MLILDRDDVKQALPMEEVIMAMKVAFSALSTGEAIVPKRIHLSIPTHEGLSLFMPAYLRTAKYQALVVKTVSVFSKNADLFLPLIHAMVLVLEAHTGRPLALIEGSSLTAIRTGAASGAATDLLARPSSKTAAIFGAGVQGRKQLEAICTVRPITRVFVYDTQEAAAELFIQEMSGLGPVPSDLRKAEDPQEACSDADIICCATTSSTPVFADQHLKPGVHINAVGSFTPEMQEIPSATVERATVFVDFRSSALTEAGDILQPIQAGRIGADHIHAELGEVILGDKSGRLGDDQITFFKSVGVAVQDAAAAQLALQNARKMGLGQNVDI